MKKTVLFLLIFLCIALVSCEVEHPQTEKEVAYVNIHTPNVTLFVGQTHKVSATVTPSDAKNAEIMWSSSNDSICRVYDDGILEAISAGNCVVRAYCENGVYAMLNVTIVSSEQIESIFLSQKTVSMTIGESYKLDVFSFPSSEEENTPVVWKSSDESVATVDSLGNVTAISAGSALIEAKCDLRLRAVCAVSVLESPEDTPIFDLTSLVLTEVYDLPKTLEYRDVITDEVITRVEITSYDIEMEMYDKGGVSVKVTVKFNGKKIYDRDGDDAENRIAFTMNIFEEKGEEDKKLDDFVIYSEGKDAYGDEPAVPGKKVGEDFTMIFEFEAAIQIEQRQFYITLENA